MISKHSIHRERIVELLKKNDYKPYTAARIIVEETGMPSVGNALSQYCKFVANELSQVSTELNERGVSSDDFRHGWIKTKQGSYFVKNERIINYDEIRDQFLKDVKDYAPKYPKQKYKKVKTPSALVIDIADLHINKLVGEWETGEKKLNINEFKEGIEKKVQELLHRTSHIEIDYIIFVGGNDVLHVDSPHNHTTSGTRQDVSMMWYEAFVEARQLYINILEKLVTIAPVHFVFVPSNHDYMSGFHLAQNIEAWFHKNNNITFDVSPAHRKYIQYGNSLIGLTHGDGAKEADLPDLMKTEAKQAYANSLYCYWYCHHLHHKDKSNYKGKAKVQLEKDYRDVKIIHAGKNLDKNRTHVEYLRSANGTDSWHHRNGYQHSPQGIEGFVHDVNLGQIGSYFV